MAITNAGKGEKVCTCDECETTKAYSGTLDFFDFVADLKKNGWLITKNSRGEWIHTCPECG